MMREGYGTVYLPGELQSGHRTADREGRTGRSPVMKVICRCVPVLPHRELLLVNLDRKIELC
jgi:hypothetical protein